MSSVDALGVCRQGRGSDVAVHNLAPPVVAQAPEAAHEKLKILKEEVAQLKAVLEPGQEPTD